LGTLSAGNQNRVELLLLNAGGPPIWISLSSSPAKKGSKVTGHISVAEDISTSKAQAQDAINVFAAIRQSEAVAEFLPDGTITTTNARFCNIFGYQPTDLAGKHHSILLEPADRASDAYRTFWQRLASGESIAEGVKRQGKGGQPIWLQASYHPVIDHTGKVCKVLKIASDVTSRVTSIGKLGNAIKELANGDLTAIIDGPPLFATVEGTRQLFNQALDKLKGAFGAIQINAESITANTEQMRKTSDAFSKRTEQQAASVEETAAALEEITVTVTDSSRRAAEAGTLVSSTRQAAEKSGEIVVAAIEAMSQIEKSSSEIGSIIGVIDDIAFQTNLLALNAGVEAARAGEAGKGFAVVAQEVRELAQRSAKAAKEIKALINASGGHVKAGVGLVGQTGEALGDIVKKVAEIDGHVAAIVKSAQEQATGLKEINVAVNQMDQGTQQNAAIVEETNAAIAMLATEISELRMQLGLFRTGEKERRYVAPAPVAAPKPASKPAARAPIANPVQQMNAKLAGAFPANMAVKKDEWEEF
jgi:methyl-accepting chemotaxis protein